MWPWCNSYLPAVPAPHSSQKEGSFTNIYQIMAVPYFKPCHGDPWQLEKNHVGSWRPGGSLKFPLLQSVSAGFSLPEVPYPSPSVWMAFSHPPGLHSNVREASPQTLSKVTSPTWVTGPQKLGLFTVVITIWKSCICNMWNITGAETGHGPSLE